MPMNENAKEWLYVLSALAVFVTLVALAWRMMGYSIG